MNFGELIQTKTFMAGASKALAGIAGVVSGIFVCVGTLGGGLPVGAVAIIGGIYMVSDGIASMAQRNATGNVETKIDKVDAALSAAAALPTIVGVTPDVVKEAVAQFGKILSDRAVPPEK